VPFVRSEFVDEHPFSDPTGFKKKLFAKNPKFFYDDQSVFCFSFSTKFDGDKICRIYLRDVITGIVFVKKLLKRRSTQRYFPFGNI